MFTRIPKDKNDFLRVISYVNIRLSSLRFLFRKDIFDHRDISIISFTNNSVCHYVLNIYSDSSHSALKYLKDTKVNINNVLLMMGDFNIRDNLWDPSFPFHSPISDDLIMVADSFDLSLSTPIYPSPTRFLDTARESNSVIDLMFLRCGSAELDHHFILPEHRLSSDHTPLTINIPIGVEIIQSTKLSIVSGSDQEKEFIQSIISNLLVLDTSNIDTAENLDLVVNHLGSIIEQMWTKNAKRTRISKHSKQWWSQLCSTAINKYRASRNLENWKAFKSTVKESKRSFFDNKIFEIANSRRGPWKLMNWTKNQKLPATEAIKFNGSPCLSLDNLWNAFHNSFNNTLHHRVDVNILNEIKRKPCQPWNSFSSHEFKSAILKCSNSSAPGPDKLSWRHWKLILSNNGCLSKIINIADACINLGHWPEYFKVSTTVVIPKPNKQSYDNLKAFRPIVLLNTLGKLIKKVIAKKLQFTVAANDFIHPSQLGGLKFKSTADAGIALTHMVQSEWVKGKSTSTLAFDISQFFPSLNHCLLVCILEKAGLDMRDSNFFTSYLVRRSTKYLWCYSTRVWTDFGLGLGLEP